MKRLIIVILAVLAATATMAACASGKAVSDEAPSEWEGTLPEPEAEIEAAEPEFDPSAVSAEELAAIRRDVQQFIEGLNRIILAKNYAGWRDALAPEYFAEISSAGFLEKVNETNVMKAHNIVLKSAQDYFNYVVVPSRANSRVDDIEIYTQTRVKAFTISTDREGQSQRWRLYDLEHIGNTWKIIN